MRFLTGYHPELVVNSSLAIIMKIYSELTCCHGCFDGLEVVVESVRKVVVKLRCSGFEKFFEVDHPG